jgi:DNA-binding beta-propeller fold protein YncE
VIAMKVSRFVGGAALVLSVLPACTNGKAGRMTSPARATGVHEERVGRWAPARRIGDGRTGSTVALAVLRGKALAFVADADDASIHAVDLDAREELARTPLPGPPSQLLVLGDGRIAVALRRNASVAILEPEGTSDGALREAALVPTADEPVGLAVTPDDATLLVTTGWSHTLEAFRTATLEPTFKMDLPREPRAVAVSRDGTKVFVSHVVGSNMTIVDLARSSDALARVDLHGVEEDEPLFIARMPIPEPLRRPFPPGEDPFMSIDFAVPTDDGSLGPKPRAACQGFALATFEGSNGEHVLAPQAMVNSGEPTVRTGGYGGQGFGSPPPEVSDVAVLDANTGKPVAGSLHVGGFSFGSERSGRGACLLPRGAAVDQYRHALYVSCMGADSLVQYDASSDDPASHEVARWRVGAGPTGVAVDGAAGRAVVWSQFDGELDVVGLDAKKGAEPARLLLLDRANVAGTVAEGRRIFHRVGDPRISSDGRACASCHPDGRDDALVWSTPDGPRQTPMLAGRLTGTAPYGWNGISDSVEVHLSKTFKRLHGTGLPHDDVEKLVAYVTSLDPPARSHHALDAREMRGQEIFASKEAGCSSCHSTDGSFTDGDTHDVKSSATADRLAAFDTPTLRFVGGTGPYFHDARFGTLHDLLVGCDTDKVAMGETKQLSEDDLAALEAYLRTL